MPNTLINVSNRLPVTVEEDRVIRSSGGLVAALEGLPEGQYETKWIGWPGAAFPEESRRQEIARKLAATRQVRNADSWAGNAAMARCNITRT
jgi:trehalose-6-phosphate synthase